MAVLCPECGKDDISQDDSPQSVYEVLTEAIDKGNEMLTGKLRALVEFLHTKADEATALLDLSENKVICGNCGWTGETDDLAAD